MLSLETSYIAILQEKKLSYLCFYAILASLSGAYHGMIPDLEISPAKLVLCIFNLFWCILMRNRYNVQMAYVIASDYVWHNG